MQKAGRIFTNILLTLLVLIALVIVVPNLFGIQTRAVLSGSMEPAIPTGSVVFAAPTEETEIEVGDPITYVLNNRGTVVTHRVVEIDAAGRQFIVKGDANDTADPNPVLWDNVLGVVRFQIPLLGYVLGFLLTTQGKIIAITVIVAVIILIFLCGGKEKKADEAETPMCKQGNDRYGTKERNRAREECNETTEIEKQEIAAQTQPDEPTATSDYLSERRQRPPKRQKSHTKQIHEKSGKKKQTYSRDNRYVPRHQVREKGGGEDEI